jgi:hypothetical protein
MNECRHYRYEQRLEAERARIAAMTAEELQVCVPYSEYTVLEYTCSTRYRHSDFMRGVFLMFLGCWHVFGCWRCVRVCVRACVRVCVVCVWVCGEQTSVLDA